MSNEPTDYAEFIPTPHAIYDRLVDGLERLKVISETTDWIHRFCNFHGPIETNLRDLQNKNPDEDWTFGINPAIPLPVTSDRGFRTPSPDRTTSGDHLFPWDRTAIDSNARFLIAGDVTVEDDLLKQYSMKLLLVHMHGSAATGVDTCCSKRHDGKHIVSRLLHFDITLGKEGDDPHPATHFQIGGNTDPNCIVEGTERRHHHCRSRLDKPRFFHPPMDPVLIFDLAVRQYPELDKLTTSHWKGTVRDSERVFWRDFYRTVAGAYTNTEGEDFEPISRRYLV